jgi:hypothetical protein
MLWRASLALGLILGLVLAPPVARERLLCRWTGEEMSLADCQNRAAAEPGFAADVPCCEQRIQTPLPSAKLSASADASSLPEPVLAELAWFETTPPAAEPLAASSPPPPKLSPLSATRILLI